MSYVRAVWHEFEDAATTAKAEDLGIELDVCSIPINNELERLIGFDRLHVGIGGDAGIEVQVADTGIVTGVSLGIYGEGLLRGFIEGAGAATDLRARAVRRRPLPPDDAARPSAS